MLNDEYSPTSLIARGYRKGAPRHGTNRRLGDIDQHVTESMTCKTCGGRVAASRCGDNASKAVRLIAREWAGVEKMRQPILTVIEESVAAQFDHEWTRVPLEGESDAD